MDGKTRRRRKALWVIAALGLVIVFGWMLLVPLLILNQSQTNGEAAEDARDAARIIKGCTTPGNACYEQGNTRTGEAVAAISDQTLRIVAAALSCEADGVTNEQALVACTIKRAQEER